MCFTDRPGEHRLRNGTRRDAQFSSRETDRRGGEEDPTRPRGRGTQQPDEGLCGSYACMLLGYLCLMTFFQYYLKIIPWLRELLVDSLSCYYYSKMWPKVRIKDEQPCPLLLLRIVCPNSDALQSKPNVVTGSGEPNPGLKVGDGGPGKPAGAEGSEPEAGAGGL